MGERLPKLIAALAVTLGVAAILAGASVFVEAWQASRVWAGSAEAQRAVVPAEAPLWLDEGGNAATSQSPAPSAPVGPASSQSAAPEASGSPPRLRAPDRDETAVSAPTSSAVPPVLAEQSAPVNRTGSADPPVPAVVAAAPADVEVAEIDFRFLDPPEPGAHARIAVSLVNRGAAPIGPISIALPTSWLQSFNVFGAVPAVLDDRSYGADERHFVFSGLAPGERQTLELHVVATAEEVEAPRVRVLLGDDAQIAAAQPRTVAPRPRPGPARAVNIPKLGVRAPVVPVPWEPPPFVVGQLQGTAAVTEGNTVLIGHLAGPLGDIFARLDRLRPGDEVVATSRGLEYRFVVSEIAVKPYDDVLPTQPTATPRLTLMTCTGQWSITRQDYSHRLWVVAEPPELAQQTIKANAERAAQAAREAEAAAARATHEAEAAAPGPTEVPTGISPTAQAPVVTSAPVAADAAPAPSTAANVAPVQPGAAPNGDTGQPIGAGVGVVGAAPGETIGAEAESIAPGLAIDTPRANAAVERRLTVRGRRMAEADPRAPLWLLVRAEVPGSRWYALEQPLEPDQDGNWQVEVDLGGPPGIYHEIRVGVVDAATDLALRRHAAVRPGEPLADLPAGFTTGARVVVERR